MKGVGQPTKLTPERHDRIVNGIRQGNYISVSAEYGGVSYATVNNWMNRGEAEQARLSYPNVKPLKREAIYLQFFEDVTRARAEAELRNVLLIQTAAREDWRAAAWYLEHSFTERWGSKQKIEHTGAGGGPIQVENMSDDDLKDRLGEARNRLEALSLAKAVYGKSGNGKNGGSPG